MLRCAHYHNRDPQPGQYDPKTETQTDLHTKLKFSSHYLLKIMFNIIDSLKKRLYPYEQGNSRYLFETNPDILQIIGIK
jgi:hypothetical protein